MGSGGAVVEVVGGHCACTHLGACHLLPPPLTFLFLFSSLTSQLPPPPPIFPSHTSETAWREWVLMIGDEKDEEAAIKVGGETPYVAEWMTSPAIPAMPVAATVVWLMGLGQCNEQMYLFNQHWAEQ